MECEINAFCWLVLFSSIDKIASSCVWCVQIAITYHSSAFVRFSFNCLSVRCHSLCGHQHSKNSREKRESNKCFPNERSDERREEKNRSELRAKQQLHKLFFFSFVSIALSGEASVHFFIWLHAKKLTNQIAYCTKCAIVLQQSNKKKNYTFETAGISFFVFVFWAARHRKMCHEFNASIDMNAFLFLFGTSNWAESHRISNYNTIFFPSNWFARIMHLCCFKSLLSIWTDSLQNSNSFPYRARAHLHSHD